MLPCSFGTYTFVVIILIYAVAGVILWRRVSLISLVPLADAHPLVPLAWFLLLCGLFLHFTNCNFPASLSELGPDFLVMGFTVIIIDRLNQRHEERLAKIRSDEEKKLDLISEMGSHINAATLDAVRKGGELLNNGSLQNAYLAGANLSHAQLVGVVMPQAVLICAKLEKTNFTKANLKGAVLINAVLIGATLDEADLRDANLLLANLQDVSFENTKYNDNTRWPRTSLGLYPPPQATRVND